MTATSQNLCEWDLKLAQNLKGALPMFLSERCCSSECEKYLDEQNTKKGFPGSGGEFGSRGASPRYVVLLRTHGSSAFSAGD